MPSWERYLASKTALERLIERGLLTPLSAAREWISPDGERSSNPPPSCVVSFMVYHQRGFGMPEHRFLHGMLHHYGVLLHALSSNGVQQMAAFVAVCEGFLGTAAHFPLFLFLFKASLVKAGGVVRPFGYCSIKRKQTRVPQYLRLGLSGSNKDWNPYWFYLKNCKEGELSAFSPDAVLPQVEPPHWPWGPAAGEQHKLDIHLLCISRLKDEGLTRVGVLEAYYRRRVATLMSCPLLMTQMRDRDDVEQARHCRISEAFPSNDEVRARLLEVVDTTALEVVPTPGQP